MDEKSLIARIKRSDRDAFDTLCRTCVPSLLTYAGLLLKSDWAEDVVQDVLYELWRKRDTLEEDGNIRGYLVRAVYNRSVNYLRRGGLMSRFLSDRRVQIARVAQEYMSPDNNPVIQALFCAEKQKQIDAAVETLTPRCREVFRLSFYHNLSNQDIARRLGIDLRTVENQKSLALKELRLKMGTAE